MHCWHAKWQIILDDHVTFDAAPSQEFAWSERDLPARRDERRSNLRIDDCPGGVCPMDKEPMYCFETSLKMLYWSMLVYRYEEVRLRIGSLGRFYSLYCAQVA